MGKVLFFSLHLQNQVVFTLQRDLIKWTVAGSNENCVVSGNSPRAGAVAWAVSQSGTCLRRGHSVSARCLEGCYSPVRTGLKDERRVHRCQISLGEVERKICWQGPPLAVGNFLGL